MASLTSKTMTPEFKVQWLEALRSGKYEQATKVLRSRSDCFCCLGVACDLLDSTKWLQGENPDGLDWGECASSMTDEKLADALGLFQDTIIKLASMNDTGTSFEAIAAYIEQNL